MHLCCGGLASQIVKISAFFYAKPPYGNLVDNFVRFNYGTWPTNVKTKPLGKSKRFLGGDGGNRTRVRKIRLSNFYEHSQLFRFVRLQINWPNCIQTIRLDPKALLAEPHGAILGSLIFMTPWLVPIRQTVPGDVTSSKEVSFHSISLCS